MPNTVLSRRASALRVAIATLGCGAVLGVGIPGVAATPAPEDGAPEDTPAESVEPGESVEPVAGDITLIAGSPREEGFSGDGGPATDARLNGSLTVAAAPDGTVYVPDRRNGRLRAVDPETGVIDTVVRAMRSPEDDVDVADGWTFSPSARPISADVAADGTVFVGSTDDISRISPDGEVTLVAGGGEEGIPDVGETVPADSVYIHDAEDVAVTPDGTVYAYVGAIGALISVDADGILRTLASDGSEASADADGTRPVGDYRIGMSSTLAYADAGPNAGTLYFADESQPYVFAVTPDGTLDIVAGTGTAGYSGDGGPAQDAEIGEWIRGLTVTDEGAVLFGDATTGTIRRIDPDGTISTVRPALGGLGGVSGVDVLPNGDIVYSRGSYVYRLTTAGESALAPEPEESGADPYADAEPGETVRLVEEDTVESATAGAPRVGLTGDPYAIQSGAAVDADGSVLVGDAATATVRRIDADGAATIAAGVWPVPEEDASEDVTVPDTVPATEHVLDGVRGIATAPDGSVVIAETQRVWRFADGTLTRVAGLASGQIPEGEQAYGDGGPATEAGFRSIGGVAVDAGGAIYVTDSSGERIRRIDPGGTIDTVAGGGDRWADEVDGHPALEAQLWEPLDVAVDSSGNVYFTERGRPHVRRVDPDGIATTVLGDSYRGLDEGDFGGDAGPGVDAELNTPSGLAVGADDVLYVADTYNARVRRMDVDGTVTTVAGTGALPDDGAPEAGEPAVDTAIGEPSAVATDADGRLVVVAANRAREARTYVVDAPGTVASITDHASGDMAAGDADSTAATGAGFGSPFDIAVGPDGLPVVASANGVWSIGETVTALGGSGVRHIAAVAGALYVTDDGTVSRLYPDGRQVWVAGSRHESPAEASVPAASAHLSPTAVAAGPDGGLYVLSSYDSGPDLRLLTTDGVAEQIDLGDIEHLSTIASSADGTLYGVDSHSRQVVRVDGDGKSTVVAAVGEEVSGMLEDVPNGSATQLPSTALNDIAVGPDGHLFLAADDGVVAVDLDEGTYAFHDAGWDVPAVVGAAADQHGNVYTLTGGVSPQVWVLVRPAEVAGPVPWALIIGIAAAVLVVGGVAYVVIRKRRRAAADAGDPHGERESDTGEVVGAEPDGPAR